MSYSYKTAERPKSTDRPVPCQTRICVRWQTSQRRGMTKIPIYREIYPVHRPPPLRDAPAHAAAQLPFSLRETVDSETRGILSSQRGACTAALPKPLSRPGGDVSGSGGWSSTVSLCAMRLTLDHSSPFAWPTEQGVSMANIILVKKWG